MFCKCGCGAVTKVAKYADARYGWVKGEHINYIKGHHRKGITEGDDVRVAKYSKSSDNGCILWTGAVDKDGYGIFSPYRQKAKRITRYIFEKTYGELRSGTLVCHTCDNPSCINPEHLFKGSNQDNMNDMKTKGRQSKGASHPKATLSDEEALFVKSFAGKLTQVELAEIYKVSEGTVSNLMRSKGRFST